MSCPSEEQLVAWLNGIAEPGSFPDIEGHLKTCEACNNKIKTILSNLGFIDELFDKIKDFQDDSSLSTEQTSPSTGDTKSECSSAHSCIESLLRQGVLKEDPGSTYAGIMGPYKIIDFIGRGGMGVVLKAYEESLNRTVALKILRPDILDDPLLNKRFRREAQLAASIRHKNIITVYAIGEECGAPYIAMEYIQGESLSARIRRTGSLPNEESLSIFRQILQALEAAHEGGLIHRDIKSANILLDDVSPDPDEQETNLPETQVYLADFGLARLRESRTRLTSSMLVLGTPDYMSPEQARGEQDIDERSDLYSAGVILYEMLAGKTPFHTGSPTGTIFKILNEYAESPLPLNDNADPRLADMALKLLAKEPDDRFQTASEALQCLDADNRISNRERARRRRSRIWRVSAAVAVVIGIVAAILMMLTPQPITAVKASNSKTNLSSDLFVRRGHEGEWEPYHTFPDRFSRDAGVVFGESPGEQTIGMANYSSDSSIVFTLLDDNTDTLWEYQFTDSYPWPDCEELGEFKWSPTVMVPAQLDDDASDEIVLCVHIEGCWPSCLVLLDPHEQKVLNEGRQFWHTGEIMKCLILDDFFGPDHPAIFASAINNKLDGFGDPPARPYPAIPGEDPPRTDYGMIIAFMVLDPFNMDGVSPPRNRHLDIDPAYVYSYAWVDLPSSNTYVSESGEVHPTREDIRTKFSLQTLQNRVSKPGEYPARINISAQLHYGESKDPLMAPSYEFDTDMNFRGVVIDPYNRPELRNRDFWEQFWKPIIRNGKYIDSGMDSDAPHTTPLFQEESSNDT